jgi:hypothetical protein
MKHDSIYLKSILHISRANITLQNVTGSLHSICTVLELFMSKQTKMSHLLSVFAQTPTTALMTNIFPINPGPKLARRGSLIGFDVSSFFSSTPAPLCVV